MEKKVQFTQDQIKSMFEYVQKRAGNNGKKAEDLVFLYNLNTPDKVYVKYTSYSVGDDNSMVSELEVTCINTDGSTSNCYDQFTSLSERMAFATDFIEIDLNKKGQMVIV